MSARSARPIVFVGNATQDSVFFVPRLPSEDEVCEVRKSVNCLGGRAECVNKFETPVAGSLVSNAALPRVRAAWVLGG